jgi:hypothetical protein
LRRGLFVAGRRRNDCAWRSGRALAFGLADFCFTISRPRISTQS